MKILQKLLPNSIVPLINMVVSTWFGIKNDAAIKAKNINAVIMFRSKTVVDTCIVLMYTSIIS